MPNVEQPNVEQPKRSLISSMPSLKSNKKADAKSSMTASKKKKKGRLKRLSGFITGESRREKRARKAAERAAAGEPPLKPGEEDEESVYGIDVDDMSIASEKVGGGGGIPSSSLLTPAARDTDHLEDKDLTFLSPKEITPALQVILLLLDPQTRRFELLQLEFDSNKALVSDVIGQIGVSVTEEHLRLQEYDGVCDRAGLEMIKTMRLSEFCKENEVVLAIPKSMSAKECAKLAQPILADPGVVSMLRATGINTDLPVLVEEIEEREIVMPETPEKEKAVVTSKGFPTWLIVTITLISVLLQGAQMYITAPLRPGSVLPPGAWMSKCGLLSILPICENAGLEVNEDGVTLYGSDGEVQWKLAGGKCRANNPTCKPGLFVKEDGNLIIGGKAITSVTISGDAPLTPWPFELEPKVRVVRK